MTPSIENYVQESAYAVTFENQILYGMCEQESSHECSYRVQGKIMAIGRIYAAQLERGAGKPQPKAKPLIEFIAERVVESELDEWLDRIPFNNRTDDTGVLDMVVTTHTNLVSLLREAIKDWGDAYAEGGGKNRSPASFASPTARAAC